MPAPRPYWPSDGGPIYAETPAFVHDGQWLIEPWNAISSLLIILPGLYFLWRLRGRMRGQIILAFCAPLLIMGGLGSTLFHGLRTERLFLMMDFFPTLAAFVLMILWLWARTLRSWLGALIVLGIAFAATWWVNANFPPGKGINISYFIRGTAFFIPLLVMLARSRFRRAAVLIVGLSFLVAALVFRSYDRSVTDVLPMGSHFLWHACTGIGGLLIADYLLFLGGLLREPDAPSPAA